MIESGVTLVVQIVINILGLFSTYIIFDFMNKFEKNIHREKPIYVLAYIVFTLVIVFSSATGSLAINLIITLVATVITGHFLYNNKKIFILYYSIYIVIMIAFQVIVSYSVPSIFRILNINFYRPEILGVTILGIIQFTSLIVSRLFIIIFRKKNIEKISPVEYLNFLVLPLFSILYFITLFSYVQVCLSIGDIILLILNVISIIILNLFVTNIFVSISKNNEIKNKLQLYKQQSKMQLEYYSQLEGKYNNSRKSIHDMKNHLQAIERLYRQGDGEKAMAYTKDMHNILDSLGQRVYADNKVLNIIINDKVTKAEFLGIKVNSKIGDVDIDFINDVDLTIIFANLLDNAIDATKSVVDNKEINLTIESFNEFLVINFMNPFNEMPVKKGNEFISSKKNHKALGIENIKIAVEKYEGTIRIDFNEKLFKVNIVIPINKR